MSEAWIQHIRDFATESAAVSTAFFDRQAPRIAETAHRVAEQIAAGGKILFFGNGGSAADAQHLAAELVGRYRKDRPSLPAIALTTDTSALTAIANDYGFEHVFERQVRGLGREGDVAVGISTSGNSPNVLAALRVARDFGLFTVGLSGRDGGAMPGLCDVCFVVESRETPVIQQVHITLGHLLCDLIERALFPETP